MSATWGILQSHHTLVVVGSRVDEMPHEHLHRSVLTVSFHTYLLLREGKEHWYLEVHDLVDTVYYFLIVHIFNGTHGVALHSRFGQTAFHCHLVQCERRVVEVGQLFSVCASAADVIIIIIAAIIIILAFIFS